MEKGFSRKKRQKKNSKSFNPDRGYLDLAIKDYIASGGKITKIEEMNDDVFIRFFNLHESSAPADEFLMDS